MSRVLGYLIGLVAFLAPFLGFLAPKGLAPLVISGGVFGVLILKQQGRDINWLDRRFVVLLVALCIWTGLSSLWAINVQSAATGSAKLMGNLIAGALFLSVVQSLTATEKALVLRGLLVGFIVVGFVVALELSLGGPIYKTYWKIDVSSSAGVPYWLNSVNVLLVLLIWPCTLFLIKRGNASSAVLKAALLVIVIFVCLFIITTQIKFMTGLLALVLGLFAAGVIWAFGRRAAIAASVMLVIVGLFAPFGFSKFENTPRFLKTTISMPHSAEHRLMIWDFTAKHADQKIVAGWGMNASKFIPGGDINIFSETGEQYGRALPLHPHNAILQMWLELGVPGIVLYLAIAVFVMMATVGRTLSKSESALSMGLYVTIMAIANLSFGVWQAWWIATLWLLAGLMTVVIKSKEEPVAY